MSQNRSLPRLCPRPRMVRGRRPTMTPRLTNPHKLAPEAYKAMMALEASFAPGSLDHALKALVKLRASQINGCAFCLHMTTPHARQHGETQHRQIARASCVERGSQCV